jgi:hypothetical protein
MNKYFWSMEEMVKLNNLLPQYESVSAAAREFKKTSSRDLSAIITKGTTLNKEGLPKYAGVKVRKDIGIVKMWTDKEVAAAKTTIEKFNGNLAKASEWLAPKLNRTPHAVMQKLCAIIKGNTTTKTERKNRIEKPTQSLQLPKGFSFDFKPIKAEMFKDHVRLYW